MGCKAAVVPVFAAEIAPAHLRGRQALEQAAPVMRLRELVGTLVMNWQVFDALGIFFGFTANIIASKAGTSNCCRMTETNTDSWQTLQQHGGGKWLHRAFLHLLSFGVPCTSAGTLLDF